ncbi:MAG: VanW family protein, partial [Patescibacteria group bacterium]
DGRYEFEGSARFGKDLDEEKLLSDFLAALNSEQSEVTLVVTEVQPEITTPDSLRAKGVTELLGYGYSSFSGSPANRIYNVNRGMNQFNGTLIEPGEEFSFTGNMGPIDGEHGWLPELVIKGDETVPEYGGGLCQVSSTMFRAALYTGLPITARKNHSYAVRYYAVPFGYGLDATVYDPAPDLKFVNNTPGAILVQGYTEGSDAYFVFYGSNDGRSVKMEGPFDYNYNSVSEPAIIYTDNLEAGERELKEYAHIGFDVDWYRTIYDATGNVIGDREVIHSSYEARPPKYFEGKTEDLSSEPSS